jgi:hypothetical protein
MGNVPIRSSSYRKFQPNAREENMRYFCRLAVKYTTAGDKEVFAELI